MALALIYCLKLFLVKWQLIWLGECVNRTRIKYNSKVWNFWLGCHFNKNLNWPKAQTSQHPPRLKIILFWPNSLLRILRILKLLFSKELWHLTHLFLWFGMPINIQRVWKNVKTAQFSGVPGLQADLTFGTEVFHYLFINC